jgi:hypothetical protein
MLPHVERAVALDLLRPYELIHSLLSPVCCNGGSAVASQNPCPVSYRVVDIFVLIYDVSVSSSG